jgi:hypothetical protein
MSLRTEVFFRKIIFPLKMCPSRKNNGTTRAFQWMVMFIISVSRPWWQKSFLSSFPLFVCLYVLDEWSRKELANECNMTNPRSFPDDNPGQSINLLICFSLFVFIGSIWSRLCLEEQAVGPGACLPNCSQNDVRLTVFLVCQLIVFQVIFLLRLKWVPKAILFFMATPSCGF